MISKKFKYFIISIFIFLLLLPCMGQEVAEEDRKIFMEAYDASKAGDSLKAYRLFQQLFNKGEAVLGREAWTFIRSLIYQETAALSMPYAEKDQCEKVMPWAEKGLAVGPPDYTQPYDVFYSILLFEKGMCTAMSGNEKEAYIILLTARSEIEKEPDKNVTQELREKIEAAIDQVAGNILGPGSYITNKGMIQRWIGKVRTRHADRVEVEITYANQEMKTGLAPGQIITIDLNDIKELTSISVDVALKGWK